MNMALDKKNTDRPYLIGRAVAYTETITDVPLGFVGQVASNPLGKLSYHLKEALNKAVKAGGEHSEFIGVADILLKDGLPARMTAEEQGQMWVGYYHQKSENAQGQPMKIKEQFEEVVKATGKDFRCEKTISGYYRLMCGEDIIHDDGACEDVNEDEETALAFYRSYLLEDEVPEDRKELIGGMWSLKNE